MRARNITCLLLTVLLFHFWSEPASAEKYASVDVQKVLLRSKAGRKAKGYLLEVAAGYEKEKDARESVLRTMKKEVEGDVFSERERSVKEKTYQDKLKEYKKFLTEAQEDLQQRNDKFTSVIVDQITKLVQVLGRSEDYDLIFVLNDGIKNRSYGEQLIYKNADVARLVYDDVSDDVLRLLDADTSFLTEITPDLRNSTVAASRTSGAAVPMARPAPPRRQAAPVPPVITISTPAVTRGIKLAQKNSTVVVIGKATSEQGIAIVTVNGQEATLDADGNFSAEVLLKVGGNKITVAATSTDRVTSTETFSMTREAGQVAKQQARSTETLLEGGSYYALIIGVKEYSDPNITPLDQPLLDAKQVREMLISFYNFMRDHVVFLENPDPARVIEALDNLGSKVGENDSLLIFYAGHGYWDEKMKQGFWLLSDASLHSRVNWLSNSTIRDYINGIKSKHTLLVADACFSGGIFKSRSVNMDADTPRSIKELYGVASRKAMTSGTLKEVPDRFVFVEYLLKRLRDNTKRYLPSEQLFASMRQAVINNSANAQVPQFGEIRETGDEGGDFIFIRK